MAGKYPARKILDLVTTIFFDLELDFVRIQATQTYAEHRTEDLNPKKYTEKNLHRRQNYPRSRNRIPTRIWFLGKIEKKFS